MNNPTFSNSLLHVTCARIHWVNNC